MTRTLGRVWQLEALVVALALALVTVVSGGGVRAWLAAAAVQLSFMHAQVADRLAAAEERRPTRDVHCYRWAARYFLGKEALWALTFALASQWPALAGCVLFLLYPRWRGARAAAHGGPA